MPSALFGALSLNAAQASLPKTKIPALLYGTAWKKAETAVLVCEALKAGFTGIDVAAQPKHYREDLVGKAVREVLEEGKINREDLYVQTKFTSVNGQNRDNMPYDPRSSISDQVRTSISSSLNQLRHSQSSDSSYIDSLVLHSPLPSMAQTLEAWQTLEEFVPDKIHNLGISNTSLSVLEALYDAVKIKPAVVQNRFHPQTGFDVPLREFCRDRGIIYQSFWTLTANPRLLRCLPVQILAESAGVEKEVALYCLVLGLENTVVLDGTTNANRMGGDLAGLERVREWASSDAYEWENQMKQFKSVIGEA
ncbi:MAG: hypothetical protein M1819_006487 [Sarea resinae]|nr:MAG: hypothetical protein M1819_006487 [Sarea resinae]